MPVKYACRVLFSNLLGRLALCFGTLLSFQVALFLEVILLLF